MSSPFSLNSGTFSFRSFGEWERIEGKNPVCVRFDLSKKIHFVCFVNIIKDFNRKLYCKIIHGILRSLIERSIDNSFSSSMVISDQSCLITIDFI